MTLLTLHDRPAFVQPRRIFCRRRQRLRERLAAQGLLVAVAAVLVAGFLAP